jgi:hypothetical protein
LASQVEVRKSLPVRARSIGASVPGVLRMETDLIAWFPSRPWVYLGARELGARWKHVSRCEVARVGLSGLGLTVHLTDRATLWFWIPRSTRFLDALARMPDRKL